MEIQQTNKTTPISPRYYVDDDVGFVVDYYGVGCYGGKRHSCVHHAVLLDAYCFANFVDSDFDVHDNRLVVDFDF